MNPAALALVAQLIPLITGGLIPLARQIIVLVHKPDPTLEDWNKMLDTAEVTAKSELAELAKKGIVPKTLLDEPAM